MFDQKSYSNNNFHCKIKLHLSIKNHTGEFQRIIIMFAEGKIVFLLFFNI